MTLIISFTHVHTSGSYPSSPPAKSYQATYGMVSWCALLERGRKRDRRHHSHRLPLLRLLSDVDRLCGERFKSRAEAGVQLAALLLVVILLHDSAAYSAVN